MQLGIGTYTYGWSFSAGGAYDEVWLVERAMELGVSLVQIADNCAMHEWSDDRFRRFGDLVSWKGVGVEVGARRLDAERLSCYVGLCGQLGAKVLRFVTDDAGYEPTAEQVISIVRSCVGELERNGVVLAIENHDRMRVSELASIVAGVDSPHVGVCLDTANSLGAGEGIDEVLEALGRYTVNLHIKDHGIRRLPHKQGFVIDGRVAGSGVLDIPAIVSRIKEFGRCRSCILEQWVPLTADMGQTIVTEQAWAERGIQYLKSLE